MALGQRIAKGAEADLILDKNWNGKKVVIKIRIPKAYRHPQLDHMIRRSRTIHEANIIHRAKETGVPTPLLYQVSPETATIVMEFLEGDKIRDILEELHDQEKEKLFEQIGYQAGKIHGAGIIHGDLTTSNMIRSKDHIYFIDFGLSEISNEIEKRGVDLNLMNRMLLSTHYRYRELLLDAFRKGYRRSMGKEADEALERMEEVAKRGRYIEKE
jgi:TP53 regulating kinase-like protein